MSRFLLLVAFSALLVPAASAAPPDPDVTLAIANVPAQVDAAGNFTATVAVQVSVSNLACLPGPGHLAVAVTATSEAGNSTTGNLTVDTVAPIDFRLPEQALQAPYTDSKDVNLRLHATGGFSGKITLVAAVQGLSGCTGANATGTSTPVSFQANFKPASLTTTDAGDNGEPVPGLEMPLLLAALAAVALVAGRRKA